MAHRDLSDHYSVEAEIQSRPESNTSFNNEHRSSSTAAWDLNTTITTLEPRIMGFSIAPEYQLVRIANQFAPMAGATASMQVGNRWSFGISGYSTSDDFTPRQISRTNSLGLKVQFAGVKLEYTPNRKRLVHVSFPFLIGAGMAKIDSAERFYPHRVSGTHHRERPVLGRRSFFCCNPE